MYPSRAQTITNNNEDMGLAENIFVENKHILTTVLFSKNYTIIYVYLSLPRQKKIITTLHIFLININ